jgi:hypothetical protein
VAGNKVSTLPATTTASLSGGLPQAVTGSSHQSRIFPGGTSVDVYTKTGGSILKDIVVGVIVMILGFYLLHTYMPYLFVEAGTPPGATTLLPKTLLPEFAVFKYAHTTRIAEFLPYYNISTETDAYDCHHDGLHILFEPPRALYCGVPRLFTSMTSQIRLVTPFVTRGPVKRDLTAVLDVLNDDYDTWKYVFKEAPHGAYLVPYLSKYHNKFSQPSPDLVYCNATTRYSYSSGYHTLSANGTLVNCGPVGFIGTPAIPNYYRTHPTEYHSRSRRQVSNSSTCIENIPENPINVNYYTTPYTLYGQTAFYIPINTFGCPYPQPMTLSTTFSIVDFVKFCWDQYSLPISQNEVFYCAKFCTIATGPYNRVYSLYQSNYVDPNNTALGTNQLPSNSPFSFWRYPSTNGLIVTSPSTCGQINFGPVACSDNTYEFTAELFQYRLDPYRPNGYVNGGFRFQTTKLRSNSGTAASQCQNPTVFLSPFYAGYGDENQTPVTDSACCAPFTRVIYNTDGYYILKAFGMTPYDGNIWTDSYCMSGFPTYAWFNQVYIDSTITAVGVLTTDQCPSGLTVVLSNSTTPFVSINAPEFVCIQSFCFSQIQTRVYAYSLSFVSVDPSKLPYQTTLMMLGNYSQYAEAPYLTVGITQIDDVVNRFTVQMTPCTLYVSCMTLPPSFYHIHYVTVSGQINDPSTGAAYYLPIIPDPYNYQHPIPSTLQGSAHSIFNVDNGHHSLQLLDSGNRCIYGSGVYHDGICYEFVDTVFFPQNTTNNTYLSLTVPDYTTHAATSVHRIFGRYVHTILFEPMEGGYESVTFPTFPSIVLVPTPKVQWILTKDKPIFTIINAPGHYTVTYNCYDVSYTVDYINKGNTPLEIDCRGRVIPIYASAAHFNWTYTDTINRNVQFSSLDDTLTWQYRNPPAFWSTIALCIILLPFIIWLLFQTVLPFVFGLLVVLVRLVMVFVWLCRFLTLRPYPSPRKFWYSITYRGHFTFCVGRTTTVPPRLQFQRPGVPRLGFQSPYTAILSVSLLCIVTLLSPMVDSLEVSYGPAPKAVTIVESTGSAAAQSTRQGSADQFADIYAFRYTVQSVNGNNGTVLVNFANNVGTNEKVTYMPSSTDSDYLTKNPIVFSILDVNLDLSTEYLYSTGPSFTDYQSSCKFFFFSERCDNSNLTQRTSCDCQTEHKYSITTSWCCLQQRNPYAIGQSCLDTQQTAKYVNCYKIAAYTYNINAVVSVDGVDYPVTTTGEQFVAGSCHGTMSIVQKNIVLPDGVCCNRNTCSMCKLPPPGTTAAAGELGDIQARGSSTIASPITGVTRYLTSCTGKCVTSGTELNGYLRFTDPVICNSKIPELFGCKAMKTTMLSLDEQKLQAVGCKQYLTYSMTCQATVVPKEVKLLFSDFSIDCGQGVFGSVVGLQCNYTISNNGLTAAVAKPIATIDNAVSPMISASDLVIEPSSVGFCVNCISITSNVANLQFSVAISGTNLKLTKTVQLTQPPQFTPAPPGPSGTVVVQNCNYLQKLTRSWNNFGGWISSNPAVFGVYFAILIGGYGVLVFLTAYHKLNYWFIIGFTIAVVVVFLFIGLVGPIFMKVPSCSN